MPGSDSRTEVTLYLQQLENGDQSAVDRLFPLVYEELRGLARGFFQTRPSGQTLDPTALVHECYVRLAHKQGAEWNGRRHFFSVAALAMRGLLADQARRRLSQKRGGGAQRIALDEVTGLGSPDAGIDVIALDDALTRLADINARQVRIVELRFLAGLTVGETASTLGISERTVYLDWEMARAWLSRELA